MTTSKIEALDLDAVKSAFRDTGPYRRASYHRGKRVSEVDFTKALVAVPQDDIIAEIDSEFTVEVWDGLSIKLPNGKGIGRRQMVQRGLKAGGEAFIVKRNGKIIGIQTRIPGVSGDAIMRPADVGAHASDFRQARANEAALFKIRRALAAELDNRT